MHEPDAPVTVQIFPPGDAVTVNDDGVPPPVPAATVIVAEPSPATAVGAGGVLGAAIGLTEPDAPEEPDVPAALVAVAVKV